MSEGRSIWRMIFTNFRKSLSLFPEKGQLMGEDSLGNKYYESPKNKNSHRKSAPRWFEPKDGEWQQDLPAEWEAWLRGRRKDPPTKEEIAKNLAIANMKKEKGNQILNTSNTSEKSTVGKGGFPKLDEYSRDPTK